MNRSIRTLSAGMGLALSAVLLVGCGDDEPATDSSSSPTSAAPSTDTSTPEATESATPDSTDTTDTATPTETSPPEPTASQGDGGKGGKGPKPSDFTPLGSELKVGDTALVKGDNSGDEYVMELTVTSIKPAKPGELDDFASASFKPKEWVGAYVTVQGTVISGDAADADPASDVLGTVDGRKAQSLIKFSTFDPCENESFESGSPGEEVTSCTIALAPKGSKVNGAGFAANIMDELITWQ